MTANKRDDEQLHNDDAQYSATQASRRMGQDEGKDPGHNDQPFKEDEEGSRRDVGQGAQVDEDLTEQPEPSKTHGDVQDGTMKHR